MNIDVTATIGFFDGVHQGHQFLLEQVKQCAAERGQESMVISFVEHPCKVLNADFTPPLLTDNEEKCHELRQQGIDRVELLAFSKEMAALTAEQFMDRILKQELNVKTLLMGYDHSFGSDRIREVGHYQHIGKKLGIEVILQEQYLHEGAEKVSSSVVRQLIAQSHIEEANELLGRPYSLKGRVVTGYRIGRKIGFPTANIQPHNPYKIVPPAGVYAVQVDVNGEQYKGMLNIGTRPTIDSHNTIPSIEVHILNFDQEIYDDTLSVQFIRKIREEQRFENVEQLTEQLHKDREAVMLS